MTNEEARNILLTSVHPQTAEEAEAIGIAVKAVERTIPKKPAEMRTGLSIRGETTILLCPQCGGEIGFSSIRHNETKIRQNVYIYNKESISKCGNCGQAIDWSEEQE